MFRMGQGAFLVVFSYKGCRFIRKGQWCAKVNILRLTVGYLNATINGKTLHTEPEIGTDGSSQTREILQVDRYGSGFGPPRRCWSSFWTVLEPNRTIFLVRNRTAGGLPGPVANTTCDGYWWRWYGALITSKCGCASGCVQLIDGGKRDPECRGVESIDFVLLWNINESMVAYCGFVVISKLNDYWLDEVS